MGLFITQNKRKSGFGASDELSSEEEDPVPVLVEVMLPHQEREPATTRPACAQVSSVRKRNLKPNSKPTIRPQVNVSLSNWSLMCELNDLICSR